MDPNKHNKHTEHTAQPMEPMDLETMKLQPTIVNLSLFVTSSQNIGMIGHVAHGKSTLTKALSNVSTGRFQTEKEKGMTIRLGYANVKIWKCLNPLCPKPWCYRPTGANERKAPSCQRPGCTSSMALVRHFSFVDSPGHHELMSTMLSGASVMDGALLVISADEHCPCPQTAEHLVAAEIMRISTAITVQNKVDLCTVERSIQSQQEIKSFLHGTRAEKSPIIPLVARMGVNVDVLCQKLVECIPIPDRDLTSPFHLLIIRSFDVNKPGTTADRLQGGVIGGSLLRGILKVGDDIEIRPGIIRTDGSFAPILTRVASLRSEDTPLNQAIPGGLIAIGLTIDPRFCKGDRLVGQVAGRVGALPPVFREAEITFQLLRHVVGSVEEKKTEESAKPTKLAKPKMGEELLLCIGSDKLRATVTSVNPKIKNQMRVSFGRTSLACADKGSKVAIFRMESPRQWRLIGSGNLCDIHVLAPTNSQLPGFSKASQSEPSIEKIEKKIEREKSEARILDTVPEKGQEKMKTKRAKGKPIPLLGEPLEGNEETLNQDQRQDQESEETHPIDRTKCGMYPSEFPEVGDFVLVKITNVVPGVGAYCTLLEYNDMPALVNEKELSRKRLKSIKQVIRVGSLEVTVVLRVDKEKGFIDLSKKRVEPAEVENHQAWYAKSKIVDRILRRVAASAKMSLQDLYRIFVWPLYKKAEGKLNLHPLESFQAALRDQDAVFGKPSLKFDVSVRENILRILMDNIKHRFPRRAVRIVATVEVGCLSFEGVNAIRIALKHGLNAYVLKKEQKSKIEQEAKMERVNESLETKVESSKSSKSEKKKGLSKSEKMNSKGMERKTEKSRNMKKMKASNVPKSEELTIVEKKPEKSKFETEKGSNEMEVKLYLEASPFYILSVQSQDKNEALDAINFIYREICTKVLELGGAASLAKPPEVQMV